MDHAGGNELKAPSFFTRLFESLRVKFQKFLDDSTPYVVPRWIVLLVFLGAYLARTLMLQGWYIITYALGIFLLNLFIQFLQPRIDPALLDDEDGEGGGLPLKQDEEFRPFVRRLPEFKFWLSAFRAIGLAMFCTFFEVFNIPVGGFALYLPHVHSFLMLLADDVVFWPILVLYFFILFGVSMKRQIRHMIKYKYVPFTTGKPRHKGKEDTGAVVR